MYLFTKIQSAVEMTRPQYVAEAERDRIAFRAHSRWSAASTAHAHNACGSLWRMVRVSDFDFVFCKKDVEPTLENIQ